MSWVYFIQYGGSEGPIKIGVTAHEPKKRLDKLQTGAPEHLELVGTIRGDRELEQRLHERFAHLRVRPGGEWFHYREELAAFMAGAAAVAGSRPDMADAFEAAIVSATASTRTMLRVCRALLEGTPIAHESDLDLEIRQALNLAGRLVGELDKIGAHENAGILDAVVTLELEHQPVKK